MKPEQKKLLRMMSLIAIILSILSLLLIFQFASPKQTPQEITQETHEQVQEKKTISQAEQLAQGYNYDEALSLLKNDDSKEAVSLQKKITEEKQQLVAWKDPDTFSHLFFHSLIVDPQKAFSTPQAKGYKDYMVTIPEFKQTIQELYQNGYVLVDINKLVQKNDAGNLEFVGISLPKDKKPLILSQDDVSYYEYMRDSGFPDQLVATDAGVKNTYQSDGKKETGDFDMVPLLDSFIKEHPDFSYQGAKGTLALTGYNGVLGYRTSKSQYGDTKTTQSEIEKAKKVAQQLKNEGWTFASHSWGHINMTTSSLAEVEADNTLWQQEVAPIVGKTSILIYPFGADIGDWHSYDETNGKFAYLKEQGFDIFCNVDATTKAWGQLGTDFYRNARINVDGIRFDSELSGKNTVLDDFISVKDVYDGKSRGM
ncbi:polysaccharide deacetylase [Enterococcus faecalis 13-SD-W-01]|nr:polysaccharide deacetylase [Enterococcus faecalis 13-SD-W-01]